MRMREGVQGRSLSWRDCTATIVPMYTRAQKDEFALVNTTTTLHYTRVFKTLYHCIDKTFYMMMLKLSPPLPAAVPGSRSFYSYTTT